MEYRRNRTTTKGILTYTGVKKKYKRFKCEKSENKEIEKDKSLITNKKGNATSTM